MFSAIRRRMRVTPATVIASLALVFAMAGGAYAAGRYVITSTKQIKPSVFAQLKGKAGANGAQGAAGQAGPQGAAGAAGGKGETGGTGPEGKEGKAGKEGKEGPEGSPWTAGGTLPEGATLKGDWDVEGQASANEQKFSTTVSFDIPLSSAPVKHFIKATETPPKGCTGTVTEPGAEKGNVCIFEDQNENTEEKYLGVIELPLIDTFEAPYLHAPESEEQGPSGTKVSPFGFGMVTFSHEAGTVNVNGTWAVTGA